MVAGTEIIKEEMEEADQEIGAKTGTPETEAETDTLEAEAETDTPENEVETDTPETKAVTDTLEAEAGIASGTEEVSRAKDLDLEKDPTVGEEIDTDPV